jgi:hypothetical protein
MDAFYKDRKEDLMMDYKSHGNDYTWWIDKAEELLISSTILEEAYRSGLAKLKNTEHGAFPNECRTLPIVIYLRALALELYLKATILKSGKELVNNERFIGNATHSLLVLAREANINPSSSESVLLSKLTDTIKFWGRYPIPKTNGSWRKKVEGIEGLQPIWTWSEEELKTCDVLLHRLVENLRI